VAFEWKDDNFKRVERWKNLRVRCLKMPTPLFGSDGMEHHFTLIEDATAELELERHKEDWRNMIAHDLRTPLSVVYGASKVLGEIPVGGVITQREADLIEMSARNCSRMGELLDMFLDVAKLEAGSMSIALGALPLRGIVQKGIEEQAFNARSRRINVDASVPEVLTVRADADLLFRVIQNVLSNALKFTPEDGRVTITAASDEGGKNVTLRVKDTGQGIPPEELPFIFDRFYQARARQQGRIKGFGLGLTFCLEALKTMGGGIEAQSTPGEGSEFIIRLPSP
jgi:two-component system sensor histidine kinase ResE